VKLKMPYSTIPAPVVFFFLKYFNYLIYN
jgi:hypothetical protein